MLGYCFLLYRTTYIPVLVFLSCCLLKGTMKHHLYEIESRARDAGGWGCCSTSCWQEMVLLLTQPVGELKRKEWKVNIYIWPKFLYKLSCVRICISFFLTRTWYTSLTVCLHVFQMREGIAGKPLLTSGAHANPNMEQLTIMYHRQWNYSFLEKHLMVNWHCLKLHLNGSKAAVFIGNVLGKFFPL